jgi:4-hydroxybenzoate polyprenyltransferase
MRSNTTYLTSVDGLGGARLRHAARTLGLCAAEARPSVQAMFALRFAAGGAMLTPISAHGLSRLAVGAAVWTFPTTATYLLNGAMDVTEDRANGSSRPIARGALSAVVALAMAAACALAGLAAEAGSTPDDLIPMLVLLAMGVAYSVPWTAWKAQTSSAGLTVIVAGLLTYLAGARAAASHGDRMPVVLAGTAMALWMGMVGAVTKDLTDTVGDRAAGRRTLAVVRGDRAARRLAAVSAFGIGTALLGAALTIAPKLVPAALVLLTGAGGVAWAGGLGWRPETRAGRRRPYRAFMITQYAVHVTILLTALY